MNIFEAIKSLVKYASDNEMIEKEDLGNKQNLRGA